MTTTDVTVATTRELVDIAWVQGYLGVSRTGAYQWLRAAEQAGAIVCIVLSTRRHRWDRAEIAAHVEALAARRAALMAQRRRLAGLPSPAAPETPQVQLRRRRSRTPPSRDAASLPAES